jgi:putative transposase
VASAHHGQRFPIPGLCRSQLSVHVERGFRRGGPVEQADPLLSPGSKPSRLLGHRFARLKSLLGTAWRPPRIVCVQSLRRAGFWYQTFASDRSGSGVRHRLYVHLVWTTRGRERLIDHRLARFLCRFLRAMARKERAYILEIGMVQTHVHLLARLHPTMAVSTLVKRLKGASSAMAAKEGLGGKERLYWAKGYSVASVSGRALGSVRGYLRGQPTHHPEDAITGWEGDSPEYDRTG